VRIKILYYIGWSVGRLVSKLIFRIKVGGWEHFPKSGGCIVATNHTSYYDPLLVGSWCPREMYFFAKKELFENKVFGEIIRRTNALPVKRGAVDRDALKASVEVINQGFGLVFFPEGTRSKTQQFLLPKPGLGLLATMAKCPIVPGYLHGSNRLKECFWGRTRMSMTFGPALSAEWVASFSSERESWEAISREVMGRIAALAAEKPDGQTMPGDSR
jgi:1-acyl-sn-glycerol-3-phosphate acyltransferase